MRIINLIENTEGKSECTYEHGLSFYIETENHKALLDLGQTDSSLKNAEMLGVDLKAIDTVVLSHGHYDHSGGMMAFAGMNMAAQAGGMNASQLFNMGAQAQNAAPTPAAAPASDAWTCSCGATSTGNFCSNCGKPRPALNWTCSCGAVNTGNFCSNCGTPRPAN